MKLKKNVLMMLSLALPLAISACSSPQDQLNDKIQQAMANGQSPVIVAAAPTPTPDSVSLSQKVNPYEDGGTTCSAVFLKQFSALEKEVSDSVSNYEDNDGNADSTSKLQAVRSTVAAYGRNYADVVCQLPANSGDWNGLTQLDMNELIYQTTSMIDQTLSN